MVNIDSALKTIYKNDRFPLTTTAADKDLEAYFSDLSLTVASDQFAVDKGDFELFQSICTEEQLKFGKCNASQVKFTLADVTDDIKGKEFSLTQAIVSGEETYTMPLGYYTVASAPKQDDLRFKNITAYDRMRKIDVDVSSWYNGLFPIGTETYTLAQFRASLLTFLGLAEDTTRLPLPNDAMIVKKTIDTSQLSGRTIIEAAEELSGAFGLIGNDGKFKHIILKPMHHDYPQSDYPGADYPVNEPYDEYLDNYEGIHFEEYRVLPIDKLIIRQEENDVGAIYGSGTNAYIIQGNFLVYGKSAAELQTIAQNAATNIFDRGYRPYTAQGIGLPYIEPGDFIKYNADDTTAGYVFSRILTGIQALQDEYEANGTEEQEQNFGVANEIIQLKGRSTKIEKSVDGVKVDVSNMDERLSGELDVLAGQVVLKVDTNGNIGYIVLNGDPDTDLTSIKVKADNISLEGLVTVNSNFKVKADGSIEAVNGKFSGDITASTININNNFKVDVNGNMTAVGGSFSGDIIGADISGSSFTSTGENGTTSIVDGDISTDFIMVGDIDVGGYQIVLQPQQIILSKSTGKVTTIRPEYISCNELKDVLLLNNATPITTANVATQTVNNASNAGHAINADYATNAGYASSAGSVSGLHTSSITADDTGFGNVNFAGTLNAASPTWVQDNFEPLGASDFRLKKNIQSFDLPDELFMAMKVKQYEFKTDSYGNGVHFGMLAQELENAFLSSNLNPYDYNLIELADVRPYTDDGMYVNDKIHRINYTNMIPWCIDMIQKLYSKVGGV